MVGIILALMCSQGIVAQSIRSTSTLDNHIVKYDKGPSAQGFTTNDYSLVKISDAVKICSLKQQEVERMNPHGDNFVLSFSYSNFSVKNDTYKVRKPVNYRMFYLTPRDYSTIRY